MVLENVVYILKHNCYRTLLVMKKQHYKLHTHIHYNYSIEVIRGKKKTTLEEYYRTKVDIKCSFFF